MLGCPLHLEPPLSKSTSRAVTPELHLWRRTQSRSLHEVSCKSKRRKKNLPAAANFTSDSSLLPQTQAQNTFNTRGRRVAQAGRGSAPRRLTASLEAVREISLICSPPELTPLTSGDAVIAAGVSFIHPVAQKLPFYTFYRLRALMCGIFDPRVFAW